MEQGRVGSLFELSWGGKVLFVCFFGFHYKEVQYIDGSAIGNGGREIHVSLRLW